MEKRGIIDPEWTPELDAEEKQAAADALQRLADSPAQRLARQVAQRPIEVVANKESSPQA